MVRQRPTAILVFAILHIVGGSLGIFASCYTIAMLGASWGTAATSAPAPAAPQQGPAIPAPPSASEIMRYYVDNVPGYGAFQFGGLGMSVLLDLLLLAGGIGLLKMQPWARVLSLIYAPLSILFHIVSFVYQLVLVVPATHDLFARNSSLGPLASLMEMFATLGVFASLLVIIYPIVVLVFMLRRSTAAALRGDIPAADVEEALADDPWREPPRSDDFRR